LFIGNSLLLFTQKYFRNKKEKREKAEASQYPASEAHSDHESAYTFLFEEERAPTKDGGFTSFKVYRCAICLRIMFFPLSNYNSTPDYYKKRIKQQLRDSGYHIQE
jgi:hypothetical protein